MRVGTHSFVSFIVLVVFCIVSVVFISLIVIIMSLRYGGGNNDGEWDAQRVDDARGSRAVRYGECVCAAAVRSMAQQRAGRQSASCQ